jgi:hypothetical protein
MDFIRQTDRAATSVSIIKFILLFVGMVANDLAKKIGLQLQWVAPVDNNACRLTPALIM